MFIYIIYTVIGAILVLVGADKLTDGAVGMAARFGISEMVIGLTIVAFGTSLPEFIVSFLAFIWLMINFVSPFIGQLSMRRL